MTKGRGCPSVVVLGMEMQIPFGDDKKGAGAVRQKLGLSSVVVLGMGMQIPFGDDKKGLGQWVPGPVG